MFKIFSKRYKTIKTGRDDNNAKQIKPLTTLNLALLSVLIGCLGGLGAVVFRGLISIFHNLFFLGKFSFIYDANQHTPAGPWGPWVIIVPVIGAVGVAFLVSNFAPEAKGHGVPEVMEAEFYNNGIIRPVVAVVKSLASALSIGTGGAIGREGPIIQIGSSIGSTIGQILPVPTWQRITLIAAGAGAGIAATFNTPVGGVLFAIEIVLQEVSVRTLVPVALATAMGTYVGQLFFGPHPSFIIPSFEIPTFQITQPQVLLIYMVLGILAGMMSALFIKSIYWMEDFFDQRIKGGYYVRHTLGMLIVGIIMYLLIFYTGHYYIEGVGYSTVQDILSGFLVNAQFLLLLMVLKLLATSLTLGSGASGGIFSPGLFIGATLGGFYGIVVKSLLPGLQISPPAFAVVGMAAIIAGSTGAATTAIVMIFEMTLDYSVIIPLTITVAISYGVRKFLLKESIYTLKLVRRGHLIPEAMRKNYHDLLDAKQIMITPVHTISSTCTLNELANLAQNNGDAKYFVLTDNEKISGVVSNMIVSRALQYQDHAKPVSEIAIKDFAVVDCNANFLDILSTMHKKDASIVIVVERSKSSSGYEVTGIITKELLTGFVSKTAELFSNLG